MTLGGWISLLRTEVADKFGDAFTTETLVAWLNAALLMCFTLRPDKFEASSAVTLVPGAVQTFACATTVSRLVQTIGGIEQVSTMVLDEGADERFSKPWCPPATAPTDPCANYVMLGAKRGVAPGQFIVTPPVPAGCVAAPTANLYAPTPITPFDPTKLTVQACFPLEFYNAIVEWFKYKEADAKVGSERSIARAQTHLATFMMLVKGGLQAEGALALGGLPDGFGQPRPKRAIYERQEGGAQ